MLKVIKGQVKVELKTPKHLMQEQSNKRLAKNYLEPKKTEWC